MFNDFATDERVKSSWVIWQVHSFNIADVNIGEHLPRRHAHGLKYLNADVGRAFALFESEGPGRAVSAAELQDSGLWIAIQIGDVVTASGCKVALRFAPVIVGQMAFGFAVHEPLPPTGDAPN